MGFKAGHPVETHKHCRAATQVYSQRERVWRKKQKFSQAFQHADNSDKTSFRCIIDGWLVQNHGERYDPAPRADAKIDRSQGLAGKAQRRKFIRPLPTTTRTNGDTNIEKASSLTRQVANEQISDKHAYSHGKASMSDILCIELAATKLW